MAAFFTTQLDFILFFYGLAFLLLGVVTSAIARSADDGAPWAALALFGFVHGTSEWLDLVALIVRDTPLFAAIRTAVMTASFVFLAEAARLELIKLAWKVPGRWIYAPLLLLVACAGLWGGVAAANAVARYAIGLVGAMGMACVLTLYAQAFPGSERRWALAVAAAFALYGIAAGAIVPAAAFWPATVFNYDGFSRVFHVPIQLVRGLLACCLAFTIWEVWGHRLIREVSSPRYTKYLQRQFVWMLAAMTTILVCGWVLTEHLGGIYRHNVQDESRGDLDLLASRLVTETAAVDSMARVLAGSPALPARLAGTPSADGRVGAVLQLDVEASGSKLGNVLDLSGVVVASTDPRQVGLDEKNSSSFQASIAGSAGHAFAFDRASGERDYIASYPVRDAAGAVLGVAVLRKSLDAFETDLNLFDRPFFLVDPHGVVIVTNNPSMMLRTLWPLSAEMQSAVARQFGAVNFHPIVTAEIVDATWIVADGERDYVRRHYIDQSDWSLVMLSTPQGIVASRVLGIIITLLMATVTLVYMVGRERSVHDTVQLDKRLELEELARILDMKASTDSLTGAFNRMKFNQELAIQIARARRYRTPLALVLYDVDQFKWVNDTYGHQVGDKALTRLTRLAARNIRNTDIHARWGGEEFIILATDSTNAMAYRLAENLRREIADTIFDNIGAVTCSFGVTQFEPTDTAETFIARADSALYLAKVNGRNRVEVAAKPQPQKSDLGAVA